MVKICHRMMMTPQTSPPDVGPEGGVISNKIHCNSLNECNGLLLLNQMDLQQKEPQISQVRSSLSEQETLLPKTLQAYLSQKADPTGFKVQHRSTVGTKSWSADLRFGAAVVRSWSEKGKAVYETLSSRKGMGFTIILRDHRLFSRRIRLTVFGALGTPGLSINCNMTFGGMLQVTSLAYSACEKGDTLLLRKLLQSGKVHISDSTGYGDTLLHVGPLQFLF